MHKPTYLPKAHKYSEYNHSYRTVFGDPGRQHGQQSSTEDTEAQSVLAAVPLRQQASGYVRHNVTIVKC